MLIRLKKKLIMALLNFLYLEYSMFTRNLKKKAKKNNDHVTVEVKCSDIGLSDDEMEKWSLVWALTYR